MGIQEIGEWASKIGLIIGLLAILGIGISLTFIRTGERAKTPVRAGEVEFGSRPAEQEKNW